jgi:hypothetical protein
MNSSSDCGRIVASRPSTSFRAPLTSRSVMVCSWRYSPAASSSWLRRMTGQ